MKHLKITVTLPLLEAFAIVRESQNPRITSYADMALAIAGRKRIARAIRRIS